MKAMMKLLALTLVACLCLPHAEAYCYRNSDCNGNTYGTCNKETRTCECNEAYVYEVDGRNSNYVSARERTCQFDISEANERFFVTIRMICFTIGLVMCTISTFGLHALWRSKKLARNMQSIGIGAGLISGK
jgi:hypothetical protein